VQYFDYTNIFLELYKIGPVLYGPFQAACMSRWFLKPLVYKFWSVLYLNAFYLAILRKKKIKDCGFLLLYDIYFKKKLGIKKRNYFNER
jgi:hypothetical protein